MLPYSRNFLLVFFHLKSGRVYFSLISVLAVLLFSKPASAQTDEFWMLADSSSYYCSVKYDLTKSLNFAEQAKQLTLRLYGENNIWYASTYILVSQAYYNARDFEQAARFGEEHNNRMKKLLEDGGDSMTVFQYSIGLMSIANIYSSLKRGNDSEIACIECMRVNRSAISESPSSYQGTLPKYLECQRKLADIYFLNGRKKESISQYEETLKILRKEYASGPARQKENANELCITLNNLGYVHNEMDNYHFAELALKEACFYGEKASLLGLMYYNDALVNLSGTLATLNQPREAMQYFKKAEAITLRLNQDYKLALLKSNMANMLNNLSAKERIEMRLQALDLFSKVNSLDKLPALNEALAQDFILSGDLVNAKKYLDEASLLYGKINRRPVTGRITAVNSLYALGQGRLREALRLNAKAISELPKHNPDYPKLWRARAILLHRSSKMPDAESAWLTTMSLLDEEVRSSFPYLSEYQREQYLDNYDEYRQQFLSFGVTQKHSWQLNGDIYNQLLNSKGILLERALQVQQNIAGTADTILSAKHALFVQHKTMLARYYRADSNQDLARIDSLEKETEALEKEISRTFFPNRRPQREWQHVRSALKPNEAAVEVVRFRVWDIKPKPEKPWGDWTDSIFYAAMVIVPTSKKPQIIVMNNGRALEEKHLQAYRRDMDRRTYDEDSYNFFWKPIKPALSGAKTIYFSPDGAYHQISLGTLRNKETGLFLSEEVDVHLVGNARALADTIKAPTNNHTIALFGYPDYRKAGTGTNNDLSAHLTYHNGPDLDRGKLDYQPLPATKEEVESIEEIAQKQGWATQLFIEVNASEERVKSVKSPAVLHIATHGYFLKDTSSKAALSKMALLNAGLVLAGALDSLGGQGSQKEDGLLTAYEVGLLPLKDTKLVTLSACETGLGLIRNGNGVFGLQRAFMAAGSESVLMSLWRVNDRVTKELMEKFYLYWMGGATKHVALRKAQEEIRNTSEQLSHPHYWGGFVLTER